MSAAPAGRAHRATPYLLLAPGLLWLTFFFFVPARILWENWKKLMGEQTDPSSSISFTVPYMDSPAGGYGQGSLFDHMGLPTVITAGRIPLRCGRRLRACHQAS